jgi:hypothetical protein
VAQSEWRGFGCYVMLARDCQQRVRLLYINRTCHFFYTYVTCTHATTGMHAYGINISAKKNEQ